MKFFILLFFMFLYPELIFAGEDTCKTDVYFGNGILTEAGVAQDNAEETLKPMILEEVYGGNVKVYNENIGKVDYAYNSTHGWGIGDLIESLLQKLSIASLVDMVSIVSDMAEIYTLLTENAHASDLGLQVKKYMSSIGNGRKVLVVAHSQGNLFAYEAYRQLPLWMQKYWNAVGIASPGMFEIKENAPSIAWDNDLVADLALNPFRSRKKCNVRHIYWENQRPYIGLTHISAKPNSTYVYESQLDTLYNDDWRGVEGIFQKFDFRVHSFNFYMGESLAKGKIKNPFTDQNLTDSNAKDDILSAIEKILNNGQSCPCSKNSNSALPDGLFWTQLNWNETQVHMELSNSLMDEDVNGCGMAALGSGDMTLYEVYPGVYPVNVVNVSGYEDMNDTDLSDEVTLKVHAVTEDSKHRFMVTDRYQYPNLGPDGGHVADIVITRPSPFSPPEVEMIPTIPGSHSYRAHLGGGNSGRVWAPPGINKQNTYGTPDKHPLCQASQSCGCLPCEYKILMYLNQVSLGPVSGATVRLYKATEEDEENREILYEGKTVVSSLIEEAGEIDLPVPYLQQTEYNEKEQSFIDATAGYEGDFILEISGGFDIDSNDDLKVDSHFRQVNGKLHLIMSQEQLLRHDYKVNILTEIAYQLSRDLLGENYDKTGLQKRLDDIAQHIFIDKIYASSKKEIGRDDLYSWIPSAYKNWLLKPYNTTLAPIVERVYTGKSIYAEAYEYVYGKLDSTWVTVPIVKSQILYVDENTSSGSEIGYIQVVHSGQSEIENYTLQGSGAGYFRVDEDGTVFLEDNVTLDYEQVQRYDLQLRVSNAEGKSKPVILYVVVKNILDAPEDKSFSGGFVREDAVPGDIVGQIIFDQGAAAIERIELTGKDSADFMIETNGTIRVSDIADLDYERRKRASITVQAFNRTGGSRPVTIDIAILDAEDVPIVNQMDVHLSETAEEGEVVGQVSILSREAVTDIELIGNGAESFTIDLNGTIHVAANTILDYEQKSHYALGVIAYNNLGMSKSGIVIIRMDNMPDVAELHKKTKLHILENLPMGTEIGQIEVESNGISPITEFSLTSQGSDNFSIDSKGIVRINKEGLNRGDQPIFSLTVRAKNAQGYSLPVLLNIHLDTNRPVFKIFNGTVPENSKEGTIIGTVQLLSSGSPLHTVRLEGEGSEKFVIDSDLKITVAENTDLDYEMCSNYTLMLYGVNDAGDSPKVPVYIRLLDLDDSIKIAGFSSSIYEDIASHSVIGMVSTKDLADLAIDHYTLSGEGSEKFIIDQNAIVSIAANASFNRIEKPSYSLQVTAYSTDGQKSNEAMVFINVEHNFVKYARLSSFVGYVKENSTADTVVGKIIVISSGDSNISSFMLTGDGKENFSIDPEGVIRVSDTAQLDYEHCKKYNLSAKAYNTSGASPVVSVFIVIQNIPEILPKVTYRSVFAIPENVPGLQLCGYISIESDSKIISLTLLGNDSDIFEVKSNRMLYKKSNISFDYEEKSFYTLQVVVENSLGKNTPVNIDVRVKDVPEPPIIGGFNISIDENILPETFVGKVTIQSIGDANITSFMLEGAGKDDFDIAIDGTILVTANGDIDYEKQSSYQFSAVAYNSSGASNRAFVEIHVNDLFDDPVIAGFNSEIDEDDLPGQMIGKVNVLSTKVPVFSFSLKGEGSEYFDISNSGQVTLGSNRQLDYETKPQYLLQAIGHGEYKDSNPVDVNISVVDVNEKAIAGIGIWSEAIVNIYRLENDGNRTLLFSEMTSTRDDYNNTGLFESHRLELEMDKFYLYEVSGGVEQDKDQDGMLDMNGTVNRSTIYALTKGSWVRHMEKPLRVNLMTDAFYIWLQDEVNSGNIFTLEEKLQQQYNPIIYRDIDGDRLNPNSWYDADAKDALVYDFRKNIDTWRYQFRSDNRWFMRKLLFSSKKNFYTLFVKNILNSDRGWIPRNSTIIDPVNHLKYVFKFVSFGEGGESYIEIIDIEDVNNTVKLSELFLGQDVDRGQQLLSHDLKTYLSVYRDRIDAFDVSDIVKPLKTTTMSIFSGEINRVLFRHDDMSLYMANGSAGLWIINRENSELENYRVYTGNCFDSKELDALTIAVLVSDATHSFIEILDISSETSLDPVVTIDLNNTAYATTLAFNEDKSVWFIGGDKNGYDRPYLDIYHFDNNTLTLLSRIVDIDDYYGRVEEVEITKNDSRLIVLTPYYRLEYDILDMQHPILLKSTQLAVLPG